MPQSTTSASSCGPSRSSRVRNVCPSTKSMTTNTPVSSSIRSTMRGIAGWSRRAIISDSTVRLRSITSHRSAEPASRICLTAHRRFSDASIARYTVDMPPMPTCVRMRYRPPTNVPSATIAIAFPHALPAVPRAPHVTGRTVHPAPCLSPTPNVRAWPSPCQPGHGACRPRGSRTRHPQRSRSDTPHIRRGRTPSGCALGSPHDRQPAVCGHRLRSPRSPRSASEKSAPPKSSWPP